MQMLQLRILSIVVFIVILFHVSNAFSARLETAPTWEGTEWINLPAGKKTMDVDDLRGRVIYLSFFQKW